ncbi:MAG: hypothetical protein Q8S21_03605 [Candidatus Paracaedibacteraceae bacterium]|nr:hypothetical protein [Candidatus Paracaedibacteraceae bacterium]
MIIILKYYVNIDQGKRNFMKMHYAMLILTCITLVNPIFACDLEEVSRQKVLVGTVNIKNFEAWSLQKEHENIHEEDYFALEEKIINNVIDRANKKIKFLNNKFSLCEKKLACVEETLLALNSELDKYAPLRTKASNLIFVMETLKRDGWARFIPDHELDVLFIAVLPFSIDEKLKIELNAYPLLDKEECKKLLGESWFLEAEKNKYGISKQEKILARFCPINALEIFKERNFKKARELVVQEENEKMKIVNILKNKTTMLRELMLIKTTLESYNQALKQMNQLTITLHPQGVNWLERQIRKANAS